MTHSDLEYLTIAMPKGKLFEPAAVMFHHLGLGCDDLKEDSRKLVLTNEEAKVKFIITKPVDLPTYVEYGAADLGIVGKDVLVEEKKDVYELLDLKFGFCRLVAAMPRQLAEKEDWRYITSLRVATKYPRTAEQYFQAKGRQVEVIKLNGSIELAPVVCLADMIVDIVSTGRTLRENNLVEVDEIMQATGRLVANRVSYKMKFQRINAIVEQLRGLVAASEDKGVKTDDACAVNQ